VRVAPNTKIKGVTVRKRTARVTFSGAGAGSLTFQCKLDKGSYKACRSPRTFKALKRGRHTLLVRARSGSAVDATPAKKTFKV
jgi:hypothetical protein